MAKQITNEQQQNVGLHYPPDVLITGCAVAQHCYNGDIRFLWENWNFDLL